METKFESRVGKINKGEQQVYNFISNFNNFKQFIPEDKVNDFQSNEDNCKFKVSGIGEVGLKIVEKLPTNMIKITGEGMANQSFVFWVQLKSISINDTRIKLTIKTDMNPMLKMMASKPLQNFLDKLVDAMEQMKIQ